MVEDGDGEDVLSGDEVYHGASGDDAYLRISHLPLLTSYGIEKISMLACLATEV